MISKHKICFSSVMFVLVFSLGFVSVDAADDRTKLEAELINPSTGMDDGKAKFEERSDRVKLSVEIEGQKSNSSFTISRLFKLEHVYNR